MNTYVHRVRIDLCRAVHRRDVPSLAFLSTSWRQLVAWMLNIAICLFCLIKLFVYGEPIVSEVEMQEYYAYKKKADQLMAEVRDTQTSMRVVGHRPSHSRIKYTKPVSSTGNAARSST